MAKQAGKGKAQPSKQAKSTEAKPAAAPAAKEKGGAVARAGQAAAPALPPSPFTLMRRFTEEMDRLFSDFGMGFGPRFPRFDLPSRIWGPEATAWMPSVDVTQQAGKLTIRADLPGLTQKDVKVEVRDGAVCIQGERRQEKETKEKGVYRSERSYGSFYREIPLPEGADLEQAKATFKNGVLEVSMPAPAPATKSRRISVEG
jgi:HSP20 family protein